MQDEIFLYDTPKKKQTELNVWMAFPGAKKFGMSSVGFLSVFKFFDVSENCYAERIFTDTEQTVIPFENVDLFGFSISFEIDFLSFFKILDKYKIPFKSKDRGEEYPLIFGGGPVLSSNPEPMCEIFDFITVGDGENINETIAQNIIRNKKLPKKELLKVLSELPGVYVPSLTEYDSKKGLVTLNKKEFAVKKSTVKLGYPLSTPILTENSFFSNTHIIELARGCPFSCKFCIASHLNKPYRCASTDGILAEIDKGLKYTNKIAFLGALIAAHPDFEKICDYVYQKVLNGADIELSVSSLRANRVSENVIKTLVACKQKHATIALEAGSERLREYIDKKLTEEELLNFVDIAFRNGLKGVKIYAIIGLPTETEEDIKQLAEIMLKLKKLYRSFEFTLSVSTFVPKAHTPFWAEGRENPKVLEKRFAYLKKQLAPKGIQVRTQSIAWDEVQTIFSRGDRRLADYAIEVYREGASLGAFKKVYKKMEKAGLLPDYETMVYKPLNPSCKPVWSFIKL